jgi:hypothetical protein
MNRLDARLKRLEKTKPNDLQALSDGALQARIDELLATLVDEYGCMEAVAQSFTNDGDESAAALVRWHMEHHSDEQREAT